MRISWPKGHTHTHVHPLSLAEHMSFLGTEKYPDEGLLVACFSHRVRVFFFSVEKKKECLFPCVTVSLLRDDEPRSDWVCLNP